MTPYLQDLNRARMQDPGSGNDLLPAPLPAPAGAAGTTVEPGSPASNPFGVNNPFDPPANLAPVDVPSPPPLIPRGPGPGADALPPPVGATENPGSDPSIPGMNATDISPDRNDAFPNRSFADIVTSIEEGPTGRFMIGVGANSFKGVIGSVQIY